jgi:hypothetical protein
VLILNQSRKTFVALTAEHVKGINILLVTRVYFKALTSKVLQASVIADRLAMFHLSI